MDNTNFGVMVLKRIRIHLPVMVRLFLQITHLTGLIILRPVVRTNTLLITHRQMISQDKTRLHGKIFGQTYQACTSLVFNYQIT